MSERAVRYWIKAAGGLSSCRAGRPPHPGSVRRRVFRIVARIWLRLPGRSGWRKVLAAAGGMLPVRLVQEALREVKRLDRRHQARGRARRRVRVGALSANVLWHMDATHLGRTQGGEAVEAQCVRDAAEASVLAASVGGVTTAADAVRVLQAAISAAGGPPLVVATDNGSPYTSGAFAEALAAHRIVHLRNLPHTPQHNARAERVFRDWKDDEALGRGVVLPDLEEAALRVARACAVQVRLAAIAPRATPLTCSYTAEQRDRFREAVCRRTEGAVPCIGATRARARQRRLAEREAIHAELEERGLIRRTRGGAPLAGRKEEEVS